MSKRYPGGVITKSPATPTGPFQTGAAPGIWTLDQQLQYQQQGVWPTAGLSPSYIEDVFSTWLYTGNGATQTITNGIDLATKGGLVWIKDRTDTPYHVLTDTVRGVNSQLYTNVTNSANSNTFGVTAFNTNGFNIGSWSFVNTASDNLVSWTFRKQTKFFDVVTYTGNGVNGRAIAHNLGSVPGCMIVKSTSDASDWPVYHRSYAVPTNRVQYLNNTGGVATGPYWPTAPTSTNFYVAGDGYDNNTTGQTYVAYVFAHDAGGFGLTGTDNVISCGTFTGDGTNTVNVNLGYEPQWVMFKGSSGAYGNAQWTIIDNMRGMTTLTGSGASYLKANSADAEGVNWPFFGATSTGFQVDPAVTSTGTFIYIAIRRGPMKVPTDATKVFGPDTRSGTDANASITGTGYPIDLSIDMSRSVYQYWIWTDRLRGNNKTIYSNATSAESSAITRTIAGNSYGTNLVIPSGDNPSGYNFVEYFFKRAPGFFDEVCYTGNGTSNTAIAHNLTAIPELWIVKARNQGTRNWQVYYNLSSSSYARLILNATDAATTGIGYNAGTNLYAQPTATNLYLDSAFPNTNAETYVTYLFATCAGVSKVGSYTGNGTTQTINCGFTGGARFVLIKRTDSTGDWYVYDTARGMTTLTDPYLLLNSTAAETATLGSVTTVSTGFALNSTILAAINVNAGSYIFLAIA